MDNSENNNQNNTQSVNNPNPASVNFAEDFAERFMNSYSRFMQKSAGSNFYNPLYANSAMKQFNTLPNRPTVDRIISWLNNPRMNEQQLRGCSEFLKYTCQYYNRSLAYLSGMMNYDYELIPLNPPPANSNKKTIDLYKKQKQKNNDWLRLFRVEQTFTNVTYDVIKNGAKFYYLRQSEDGNTLQSLPDNYCYINGRTDYGFTYSMSMTYFMQFQNSIEGFAPEFYDFYQEFLDKKNVLNEKANPYRQMPVEDSVVFVWDDTTPNIVPPLSGVFKDALEIEAYNDLLKLKAQLETFEILFFKSPTDNDGKPTISAGENAGYMALLQTLLPVGVAALSAPLEMTEAKFNQSQTMNNIIALGSSNYWNSTGITSVLFSGGVKSAVGIQLGVQSDFEYVSHLFDQYERFVNYQLLNKVNGKYNFQIKFLRRSSYSISESRSEALQFAQSGTGVSRLLSSLGYEPYQHEAVLIDNKLSGFDDLMTPLLTSFTISSQDKKGGRPTAEENGGKVSDSSDDTRSGGYNQISKLSLQQTCLNCGKNINPVKNIHGIFCNEDCQMEFAQNIVDENN